MGESNASALAKLVPAISQKDAVATAPGCADVATTLLKELAAPLAAAQTSAASLSAVSSMENGSVDSVSASSKVANEANVAAAKLANSANDVLAQAQTAALGDAARKQVENASAAAQATAVSLTQAASKTQEGNLATVRAAGSSRARRVGCRRARRREQHGASDGAVRQQLE